MDFLQILFGSEFYLKECELRQQVLREPLGLNLFTEDLRKEERDGHFGLFHQGELVACLIAVTLSKTEVKLRQMAVLAGCQGQGCGKKLIRCVEKHLAAQGIRSFSMHARTTAIGFYEKLGYSRVGDEFIEVGIPHVKMEKRISCEADPC